MDWYLNNSSSDFHKSAKNLIKKRNLKKVETSKIIRKVKMIEIRRERIETIIVLIFSLGNGQ